MTQKPNMDAYRAYLADIVMYFDPEVSAGKFAIQDIVDIYETAQEAKTHDFEYNRYEDPETVGRQIVDWARKQYFASLHDVTIATEREEPSA